MATAKAHWFQTVERIGQQWIELDNQYVTDPVYVSVLDIDQEQEWKEIMPWMLPGEVNFSVRPMTESLIREARRAEATSQFQALGQFLPVVAGIAMQSQGAIPAMNPWPIIEDYLEAFDRGPVEKYQMKATPAPAPQGPPPGSPQQQQPGQGVTNGALAAGPQSPSNPASQSSEVAMAQFLASGQGGTNA